MTTFPASGPASDASRAPWPSQGTATITTSADAEFAAEGLRHGRGAFRAAGSDDDRVAGQREPAGQAAPLFTRAAQDTDRHGPDIKADTGRYLLVRHAPDPARAEPGHGAMGRERRAGRRAARPHRVARPGRGVRARPARAGPRARRLDTVSSPSCQPGWGNPLDPDPPPIMRVRAGGLSLRLCHERAFRTCGPQPHAGVRQRP